MKHLLLNPKVKRPTGGTPAHRAAAKRLERSLKKAIANERAELETLRRLAADPNIDTYTAEALQDAIAAIGTAISYKQETEKRARKGASY